MFFSLLHIKINEGALAVIMVKKSMPKTDVKASEHTGIMHVCWMCPVKPLGGPHSSSWRVWINPESQIKRSGRVDILWHFIIFKVCKDVKKKQQPKNSALSYL